MSAEQMNKYIEYKIEKLIAMMEKLPADSKVKVPLEFLELINVDGGFDSDTDDDEGSTTNEEVDECFCDQWNCKICCPERPLVEWICPIYAAKLKAEEEEE